MRLPSSFGWHDIILSFFSSRPHVFPENVPFVLAGFLTPTPTQFKFKRGSLFWVPLPGSAKAHRTIFPWYFLSCFHWPWRLALQLRPLSRYLSPKAAASTLGGGNNGKGALTLLSRLLLQNAGFPYSLFGFSSKHIYQSWVADSQPWRIKAKFICGWKHAIGSRPSWCSGPTLGSIRLLCVLSYSRLGKQAQTKAHCAPSFQKVLLETELGSVSETKGECCRANPTLSVFQ